MVTMVIMEMMMMLVMLIVDSDADDDGGGGDDHGAHAQYAVLLKTPVARSRPSTNWILLWRHS